MSSHRGQDTLSDLGTVVSLCDKTGNMVQPWAEAGYECYCYDIQHLIRVPRQEGNVHYMWGDARTVRRPPGNLVAAFAFPPCTHVAGSGSRDYVTKGGQMLRDALEIFEACRQVCEWSGVPYCIENPVGVLSSIPHIGKPNYYFNPWEYTGYCTDDNYTKKTCLWSGHGFGITKPCPDLSLGPPDDRIHKTPPGKNRADVRSETPMGFARAVFLANAPHLQFKEAA